MVLLSGRTKRVFKINGTTLVLLKFKLTNNQSSSVTIPQFCPTRNISESSMFSVAVTAGQ